MSKVKVIPTMSRRVSLKFEGQKGRRIISVVGVVCTDAEFLDYMWNAKRAKSSPRLLDIKIL